MKKTRIEVWRKLVVFRALNLFLDPFREEKGVRKKMSKSWSITITPDCGVIVPLRHTITPPLSPSLQKGKIQIWGR